MANDASSVFFHHLDEVPFMDLTANLDKARPAPGSEARIKWLGGDSATGPWVYYIEHPQGAVVKPHKHHAPRIEFTSATIPATTRTKHRGSDDGNEERRTTAEVGAVHRRERRVRAGAGCEPRR